MFLECNTITITYIDLQLNRLIEYIIIVKARTFRKKVRLGMQTDLYKNRHHLNVFCLTSDEANNLSMHHCLLLSVKHVDDMIYVILEAVRNRPYNLQKSYKSFLYIQIRTLRFTMTLRDKVSH